MDKNKLPHGTIVCPHCGSIVSGCLDVPTCDECGKFYWPIAVIKRHLTSRSSRAAGACRCGRKPIALRCNTCGGLVPVKQPPPA